MVLTRNAARDNETIKSRTYSTTAWPAEEFRRKKLKRWRGIFTVFAAKVIGQSLENLSKLFIIERPVHTENTVAFERRFDQRSVATIAESKFERVLRGVENNQKAFPILLEILFCGFNQSMKLLLKTEVNAERVRFVTLRKINSQRSIENRRVDARVIKL